MMGMGKDNGKGGGLGWVDELVAKRRFYCRLLKKYSDESKFPDLKIKESTRLGIAVAIFEIDMVLESGKDLGK